MEINSIAEFLYQFGFQSISYFWMPMVIWSILTAGFIISERHINKLPPRTSYQIFTALMLALPLGVALVFIAPFSIKAPEALQIVYAPASQVLSTTPDFAAEISNPAIVWHVYHALGAVTVLLCLFSLFKLGRLIRESILLNRLGLSIRGIPLSQVSPELSQNDSSWGITRDVHVVFSETAQTPMTFGWKHAVIIIPQALKEQQESLHMTLIHELSHIRNADFIRQWIEKAIASLFFFIPVVGFLARKIDHLREMNCDWEVLNQKEISPKRYASLLLDFSSPASPVPQLSLSMSAEKHNLTQRIKAMKNYPLFAKSVFQSRKITLLLSVLLLVVSTLIVACEVNFETDNSITIVEAPAEGTQNNQSTPNAQTSGNVDDEVFMIVENMPQLIGGLEGIQSRIKYPATAKEAGIEGRVFVQFIVDTEGRVTEPVIIRGIGGGCDEEALRAIREAQFVPGRQRGQAVKVKMSLPVTFRLQGVASEETAEVKAELRRRIIEQKVQLQHKMSEIKWNRAIIHRNKEVKQKERELHELQTALESIELQYKEVQKRELQLQEAGR